MILVSVSSVKSLIFEGHSKVFNLSTVSAKCLLNVLAISSLFTEKVSFSTISFVFVVISSFSIRIILESPCTCLQEKEGLHLPQKGFDFLMSLN